MTLDEGVSMSSDPAATPQPAMDNDPEDRLLTVPNLLCVVRLLGAVVLFGVALADRPQLFLWLFVFLAMTDWIDGKLAVLLDQRSAIGPRLDSWADGAMYGALLCGGLYLHWEVLQFEIAWLTVAFLSYVVSTSMGLLKFRKWPSYHTRLAKTSWLLVLIGAVCILNEWTVWPLRVALLGVTLANIESMIITLFLDEYRTNVGSLYRVLRTRSAHGR